MNIDQALREEVEALLANQPASINTKPTSPLSKRIRVDDNPSVFHSTWQIINNPFDTRIGVPESTPATKNQDDFSDFSAAFIGLSSNIFKCQLPEDEASLHSFELSETGLLSQANSQSVGPPSLQDSTTDLYSGNSCTGDIAGTERPNKVRKRHSSRILDHSKLGPNQISTSEISTKSSSNGLNKILDSNTSVGSTHRASNSPFGPRCANDYMQRVRKSEIEKKQEEIPTRIYEYPNITSNISEKEDQPYNDTPVLNDGRLFSPINKTFLDCVNEQIQHIKYEQAKERLLFCSTNAENMGDVAKAQSDSSQDVTWEVNVSRSKTTSIGTNPVGEELKPSTQTPTRTKVDLCIQTDSSQITSLNSPNPWGLTSKADSQISLMGLKAKRLGCHRSNLKQSFYPLSPDTVSDECISNSRRLPRTRLPRSSSFFGNFLNFNNAMGITRYSLQAAWNTAEEIFYGYIVPPEIENEPPIEDNYEENEGRMAVSIMKLMGISVDTRHAIYREVLGEIHALNDFSVGTVQAISSVIDWICTGKHGGTKDLIAKTRLLCTSQTEVDPDSESWKGFERDMYIFTNAVVKTVGHAAKAVSRQYSNGSNDSLPASVSSPASQCYIGQNTDPNENPNGLSIKFNIPESREGTSSAVSTPEEVDFDADAPVNPDLISQLVTDSEFDLPVTPIVPGTGSTTSNLSTGSSSVYGRRSRIPIRVDSARSQEPKDTDENFNLKVLKSALRHDQKETYTCEVRNFKQRFASPPADKPLSRQASCSNYSYANAYKTSQLKKGLSPGSSNSSLPTTSKCAFRSGEDGKLRERFLCREDALLLKECRRLTALTNSNDSSNFGSGGSTSMNESRNGSPPSYIRNLQTGGSASYSTGFDRNILPADISHLASAIASVATSVTSTLLSRASSAASYIPSFTDTFGPQVDAECRFPECSPDGPSSILDTIQQAASNVIFGFDEPLTEPNIRPRRSVRSINRFPMSLDFHDHSDSLKPKINASVSNRSQSGSESAMSLNSSHNDAAWELFDYIKRGEAEKTKEKMQMAARKFSEQGIAEQQSPDYLESPGEPSVTARLSKAALTGLFNAFTESPPSILTSAPQSQHSVLAQEESLIHPRSSPSPTPTQCTDDEDGQKYRTCSGHNYILNSRMSSTQANLRANPSIPLLFAPQNSDTGFDHSIAQLRMEEDVAYLQNIIKEYYNDKLKKNPIKIHQTPMTTQQRSRSHQQESGRSKIPRFGTKTTDNKILSSSNEPSTSTLSNNLPSTISLDTHVTSHVSVRNDYNLSSNLEFCTGPGNKAVTKLRSNTTSNNARPKIVHPSKAPVPSRAAPMKSKPKVHVLDVSQLAQKPPQPTKYKGSNGSSGANSITASRTPSFASSNATGKSYLNILKQKEKTVSNRTPGRGIGSYSATNRHIQQCAHQEGHGVGSRRNESGKNVQRRSSHEQTVDGSGYKYDDGTHKINPGSSLCSSSCSTGPVSINASAHQPINHGNKNQNENVSDVDNDTNNIAHIPNGPLFFPSLDNSRLPLPPMLTNPFARFRGSGAGKDTCNNYPDSPSNSAPNSRNGTG